MTAADLLRALDDDDVLDMSETSSSSSSSSSVLSADGARIGLDWTE